MRPLENSARVHPNSAVASGNTAENKYVYPSPNWHTKQAATTSARSRALGSRITTPPNAHPPNNFPKPRPNPFSSAAPNAATHVSSYASEARSGAGVLDGEAK